MIGDVDLSKVDLKEDAIQKKPQRHFLSIKIDLTLSFLKKNRMHALI